METKGKNTTLGAVLLTILAFVIFIIFKNKIGGINKTEDGEKLPDNMTDLSGFGDFLTTLLNPSTFFYEHFPIATEYVVEGTRERAGDFTDEVFLFFFLGMGLLVLLNIINSYFKIKISSFLVHVLQFATSFVAVTIFFWVLTYNPHKDGDKSDTVGNSTKSIRETVPERRRNNGDVFDLDFLGSYTSQSKIVNFKAGDKGVRVRTPSRTDSPSEGAKYDPSLGLDVILCSRIISPDVWFHMDGFSENHFQIKIIEEKNGYQIISVNFSEEMQSFFRKYQVGSNQNIGVEIRTQYYILGDVGGCSNNNDYNLDKKKSLL